MTVFTPGKLLLFGEHAAVFGFPAVGMALSRGLTATLSVPKNSNVAAGDLTIEINNAKAISESMIAQFIAHIKAVAVSYDLPPLVGTLHVTSELPIGSGFGSSAALCTAIARLLAPDSNEVRRTWRIAHELERFFHGTPSGIDTGLTTLGGAQAFRFDNTISDGHHLPTTVAVQLPDCVLTVGSIPRERSTKALVAHVGERRRADPRGVESLLARLGALGKTILPGGGAADRSDATTESNVAAFGKAATDAQAILRELGVSTPQLDEILREGKAAGALGGKLSGAGGGGAFYLVSADEEGSLRVRRAIDPIVADAGGIVFPLATLRR